MEISVDSPHFSLGSFIQIFKIQRKWDNIYTEYVYEELLIPGTLLIALRTPVVFIFVQLGAILNV